MWGDEKVDFVGKLENLEKMQLVVEFWKFEFTREKSGKVKFASDFSVFSVVEAIQLPANWVSEWPENSQIGQPISTAHKSRPLIGSNF